MTSRWPCGSSATKTTTRRAETHFSPDTARAARSTSAVLDDYIAVRQVAFDLWFTGTAQVNPTFAEDLDNVHRWSADMLDIVGF